MRLQGPDRELLWKLTDRWPPRILTADTLEAKAEAHSKARSEIIKGCRIITTHEHA
jgi:hypothetical protein